MILAINTASSQTAIALLDPNSKLISESSWQSQNDEAEKLMPEIHKLLQQSDKDFSDIKSVIVIKGPGSFTGLRIGVTVANTIAYLNNCNLYAIDTFTYHWQKMPEKVSTALLVFAGKRGVYVNHQDQTEIINLNELNEYLSQHSINKTFGDISDDQLSALNIKFTTSKESFGETISKLNLENLESTKIIRPNYIKKPNITPSKKPFSLLKN